MSRPAPTARSASNKAAPIAFKLDPPSWWAGSSLNPIRLLVAGRGLSGARVSCDENGVSCGAARASANGHHLFIDLKISPAAAPGRRTLTIRTAAGQTRAPFDVLPKASRKRRLPRLSPDDVIYLVMPDRFAQAIPGPDSPLIDRSKGRSYHGGNLRGIIERLGYIKDLGATALWLTPVYANADAPFPPTSYSTLPFTHYHGYGPVDYYGVDKRLGDAETLRELIAKAHGAGVKVILDHVVNHASPQHAWVDDPPTPTWFHGAPREHLDHPFHHWMAADPYAADEAKASIMDGWLGNELPDLNQDDPEVGRYLIQQAVWWPGVFGFDAWRHDSMNYVPRPFWRKCAAALERELPGLPHIAEVNSDDPYLVSFYQGGRAGFDGVDTGMDSCFDFPLRRAVRRVFLDHEPMSELPAALSRDRLYPAPEMLVTFLGLHDDWRFMNHPKATPEALKLAFTFLLTTRGIPMIYSGDEIAMPGGDDPDNRRDFPGGFPGDPRDAFAAEGRTEAEAAVFEHVRALARLRASCAALRRGRLAYLGSSATSYAYARVDGAELAVVGLNNADRAASVEVPAASLRLPAGTSLKARLGQGRARSTGRALALELAPSSASVFTIRKGGVSHD